MSGLGAVAEIVRAIRAADASGADLVVVVRGGGSYEDLFCFSDEAVVRAIAACATPTVAAIGHERDQPLIELAADCAPRRRRPPRKRCCRSATTCCASVLERGAAARRAFSNRLQRARAALDRIEHRSPVADPSRLLQARRQAVDVFRNQLAIRAERQIVRARNALAPLERRLTASSPRALLERRRGRVAQLHDAVERLGATIVVKRRARLAILSTRLQPALRRIVTAERARFEQLKALYENSNNHAALLQRGYAVVKVNGRVVRDPADAPPGSIIEAELARGTLRARVEREGPDGGEQIKLF